MELVHGTPLAARVTVAMIDGSAWRRGVLTAKATFRVDDVGAVVLDADDPIPVLDEDTPGPSGVLPADRVPRDDDALDVVVLGWAHGRGHTACDVTASVGAHTRRLRVTGDRVWLGDGRDARIGPAEPFDRMPLTWDRAFGGSASCWLDAHAPHVLADPVNPHGRGFDAASQARDLGRALRAPAGYPRLDDPVRRLPNLEDPGAPVRQPEDVPAPVCWATVPPTVPLRALALAEQAQTRGTPPAPAEVGRALALRGHPCWELPAQAPGTAVSLTGMTAQGWWGFCLPDLRLEADYVLGDRRGTRALTPQGLVLLPEEGRFTLTWRMVFTMAPEAGEERCLRLRCEGDVPWPA
ncbi:MAG: DUF2169 domain-containing protein [Alphaproteobacteria bacterium]|nr:DUF2169 domain-containing protein [Alphaproteobacteria bacterium]